MIFDVNWGGTAAAAACRLGEIIHGYHQICCYKKKLVSYGRWHDRGYNKLVTVSGTYFAAMEHFFKSPVG